jgi:hypothetical protein
MENTIIQNETSIWNPCVALQLNRKLLVLPFHNYGGVGIEVLNLLEEVAEYVSESREQPNAEGTLRYYRREIACASQGDYEIDGCAA